MKPLMHVLETNIFSLYHVIVRPTKIFNNLCKVNTNKVLYNGLTEVVENLVGLVMAMIEGSPDSIMIE